MPIWRPHGGVCRSLRSLSSLLLLLFVHHHRELNAVLFRLPKRDLFFVVLLFALVILGPVNDTMIALPPPPISTAAKLQSHQEPPLIRQRRRCSAALCCLRYLECRRSVSLLLIESAALRGSSEETPAARLWARHCQQRKESGRKKGA